MATVYLWLIVGFALLVRGADYFVEGSSSAAKLLRVPKYHVYTAERLQRQAQELAGREDADMEALPAFSRLILNR